MKLTQALACLFLVASAVASAANAEAPPAGARGPVAIPVAAAQATEAHATPLVAQNAWVRAIPGSDMAAAYLTLHNPSPEAVTVIGIQSPVAGHAMIHETTVQGGQSKMRPHEQLVIAPGATVKLEPGGLHVMLHDLKQPLAVGQSVPLVITLGGGTVRSGRLAGGTSGGRTSGGDTLAGGVTLQVTAVVRPLSAE